MEPHLQKYDPIWSQENWYKLFLHFMQLKHSVVEASLIFDISGISWNNIEGQIQEWASFAGSRRNTHERERIRSVSDWLVEGSMPWKVKLETMWRESRPLQVTNYAIQDPLLDQSAQMVAEWLHLFIFVWRTNFQVCPQSLMCLQVSLELTAFVFEDFWKFFQQSCFFHFCASFACSVACAATYSGSIARCCWTTLPDLIPIAAPTPLKLLCAWPRFVQHIISDRNIFWYFVLIGMYGIITSALHRLSVEQNSANPHSY